MKRAICLVWCLAVTAWSTDTQQLNRKLEEAAKAQGKTYIEARTTILEPGTNAIPMLIRAAQDPLLTWQQRLVARICCERLAKNKDIETLRNTDWQSYPPYQPQPKARFVIKKLPDGSEVSEIQPPGARIRAVNKGPSDEMGAFAVSKCLESQLWYYYLELTWKNTDEATLSRFDNSFDKKWPIWCRRALKNQPEEWYLHRVVVELLRNDATLDDRQNMQFYTELLNTKKPDAVAILVERYDAYNKREVTGSEIYPGSHAITYRGMFEPILSFADSRHVDLLEKFISERPALTSLKDQLANVRSRPAPEPVLEPPFRLGTNLVDAITVSRTISNPSRAITATNVILSIDPPADVTPSSPVNSNSSPGVSTLSFPLVIGLFALAGCVVAVTLLIRKR